jgi:hypothetical protein
MDGAQVERALVEIEHIGEHDTAIETLMIALSTEDLPPDALKPGNKTVIVSRSVMSLVLNFVIGQTKSYTAESLRSPFGTLEVSWRSQAGSGKYVVPSEAGCSYLHQLKQLAKGETVLEGAVRYKLLQLGCKSLAD